MRVLAALLLGLTLGSIAASVVLIGIAFPHSGKSPANMERSPRSDKAMTTSMRHLSPEKRSIRPLHTNSKPSVLVSYAYAPNPMRFGHLDFFLTNGVTNCAAYNVEYHLTINGNCPSGEIECEHPEEIAHERNLLFVHRRANKGFDFGAHASLLETMKSNGRKFDFHIFLNGGVMGPFTPVYMPPTWHWTQAFVERFSERVKLVGTSIVCLTHDGSGHTGPRVEGFAFALDAEGLKMVLAVKTVFFQHNGKVAAIINGEYGLTAAILKAGYTIDSLQLAYENVDWRDESKWSCNQGNHPSRERTYFGISLHPLEVIFHKVYWANLGGVNEKTSLQYRLWKRKAFGVVEPKPKPGERAALPDHGRIRGKRVLRPGPTRQRPVWKRPKQTKPGVHLEAQRRRRIST